MDGGKLSKFNTQNIFVQLMKYGSHILFAMSGLVLSYLSFVQNLELNPNIRDITTIALVALILNYLVWNAYYQRNYNGVLSNDLQNIDYCIHKRYWLARRGWTYEGLQDKIRSYTKIFVKSWIEDICEQLGLTEQEITQLYTRKQLTTSENQVLKYSKYSLWYRHLIKCIAKKKYPKPGIRTPRDLLYILAVGKSSGMKIEVNKAESFYKFNAGKKLISLICGTILVASLTYDFIDGDWKSALLKLGINLIWLFSSFFNGSMTGVKAGQIKLAVAEEISEKLEEWKNEPATEIPFKDKPVLIEDTPKVEVKNEPRGVTIDIT